MFDLQHIPMRALETPTEPDNHSDTDFDNSDYEKEDGDMRFSLRNSEDSEDDDDGGDWGDDDKRLKKQVKLSKARGAARCYVEFPPRERIKNAPGKRKSYFSSFFGEEDGYDDCFDTFDKNSVGAVVAVMVAVVVVVIMIVIMIMMMLMMMMTMMKRRLQFLVFLRSRSHASISSLQYSM